MKDYFSILFFWILGIKSGSNHSDDPAIFTYHRTGSCFPAIFRPIQFLNDTGDKGIVKVTAGPNPAYTKTAGE